MPRKLPPDQVSLKLLPPPPFLLEKTDLSLRAKLTIASRNSLRGNA